MNRLALLSLALIATLALTACSDDSGGGGNNGGNNGGGGNFTGQPSDRKLSDFTEEDIQDACEQAEMYGESLLTKAEEQRIACAYAAILIGAFDEDDQVGTCQMSYDACIANPEEFIGEPDEEEPGDDECIIQEVECDATVGELEACFAEQIAQIRSLAQPLDCASAFTSQPLGPGPKCTTLMQKCPELFEDENNGGSNNGENNGGNNGNNGVNNGGPEHEFRSHGGGCGGPTFEFDAELRGEADRVELTLTAGEETEVHPLTRGEDTEEGLSTWLLTLDSTGTFAAGESTAISCDDDYEQIFRAYVGQEEVACGGEACSE